VHARLVERFGRKCDEDTALAAARRADLLRMPLRAVRGHARWALSRSLYRDEGHPQPSRRGSASCRQPRVLWLLT
jgi:hypothetical protein